MAPHHAFPPKSILQVRIRLQDNGIPHALPACLMRPIHYEINQIARQGSGVTLGDEGDNGIQPPLVLRAEKTAIVDQAGEPV